MRVTHKFISQTGKLLLSVEIVGVPEIVISTSDAARSHVKRSWKLKEV